MFTDIVNSTAMKRKMPGETSGRRQMAFHEKFKEPHEAIIRKQVSEHEGVIVEGTGDGFFIVFAAAEALIEKCGYHRRDEELADAKKAILGE